MKVQIDVMAFQGLKEIKSALSNEDSYGHAETASASIKNKLLALIDLI